MSNDIDDPNKRREAFEARKQKIEELRKSGQDSEADKESDELKNEQNQMYLDGILKRDASRGGASEIPMMIKKSKSVIANLADGEVTASDVQDYNGLLGNLATRASELEGKISILRKLNNKKSKNVLADLLLKKQYLRSIKKVVSDKGSIYISGKKKEVEVPKTGFRPKPKTQEPEQTDFFEMLERIAKDYLTARARTRGFYNAASIAGTAVHHNRTAGSNAKERLKELMQRTRRHKIISSSKTFSVDRAKDLLLRDKLLQGAGR